MLSALLALLISGVSSADEVDEVVFFGDSTNMSCCSLWCCGANYPYCGLEGMPGCVGARQTTAGGNYKCQPNSEPTNIGMCGSGDFVEWTTPDLELRNYTINVTAGCMAYGDCTGDGTCALTLSVDGRGVSTLKIRDFDNNDKSFSVDNQTYFAELEGVHSIRVTYNNDCFAGSSGDRNLYTRSINITTKNESADLWINESEIWLMPLNETINEGDPVKFMVMVRNKGNATAYNFSVRFKDDDNPDDIRKGFVQEQFIDGLRANSSHKLIFSWNATGASRELSFFADSGKVVAESNESNNYAFYNITIAQAPPPDYTPLFYAGAALSLLLLTAIALLVWRALSFRPPEKASNACPRCGMPVAHGAKTCPVCGKSLI